MILVIGKTGQVAKAIARVVNQNSSAFQDYLFVGRDEADLSKPTSLHDFVLSRNPSTVINAAAYTAVDQAEQEPEEAMLVNAEAPGALASACAILGIPLIHFSTDYVFSGSGTTPWLESDPVQPVSMYGRSKERGEQLIRERCDQHLIFRTSWVYFDEGKNFVRTMLRLGAEREQLRVVDDQVGAPTSALDIARAVSQILPIAEASGFDAWGTYHLVAQGETSWRGFAEAIFSEARELAFELKVNSVAGIPTKDYPTPATRPLNSRLNTEKLKKTFGIELPHWRLSLKECLQAIAAQEANGASH